MKIPARCTVFHLVFWFAIIISIIDPFPGKSTQLGGWHLRNPLPTPLDLNAITYSNGIFVAVGQYGTVLTSYDGLQWTQRISGTTHDLISIVFGNGLFVAGGISNTLLTSRDGITWTQGTPGLSAYADLSAITYGNNLFVALSNNGRVVTSSDGAIWTLRAMGTTNNMNGIVYGNGVFVAVGYLGTLFVSSDGASWSSVSAGTPHHLMAIAFANNTFVAVGDNGTVITSADGLNWSLRDSGNTADLFGLAFGNGVFVAAGSSGGLYTSPDGIFWTTRSSEATSRLRSVTFGANGFVAVGGGGQILTSRDGTSWSSSVSGQRGDFFMNIIYANGMFVATSIDGTIATSEDGVSWDFQSLGISCYLSGVAFGAGVFVVSGWERGVNSLWLSADGHNWSAIPWESDSAKGIVYGNGLFVAVGFKGVIQTSPDGRTWTSRTSGTSSNLNDVDFGNGLFVVAGDNGTILTSVDGLAWSQYIAAKDNLEHIAAGNGRFVVTGRGKVYCSADGEKWKLRALGTNYYIEDVAFGNNTFILTGYSKINSSGIIATSAYGMIWTPSFVGPAPILIAIAAGNDTFVAAGANGTIIQSDSNGDSAGDAIAKIEALYLARESAIAARDLTGLMSLYHPDYLDGGHTALLEQARFEQMFHDYDGIAPVFRLRDPVIAGDTATIGEDLVWQGISSATGEIHGWNRSKSTHLKKDGTKWRYYGNQAKYGVRVQVSHDKRTGDYDAAIHVVDPEKNIAAMAVTGPGLTEKWQLNSFAYNTATSSWASITPARVGDHSQPPDLSALRYNVTIKDAMGSSLQQVAAESLGQYSHASFFAPQHITVKGKFSFRWKKQDDTDSVHHRILLHRGTCPEPENPPERGAIWISPPVKDESVLYDGPMLADGDYCHLFQSVDPYGNTVSQNTTTFRIATDSAGPLDTWHENPLQGRSYWDIIFDRNISEEWTASATVAGRDLRHIAYGNKTFVATDEHAIFSSPDGRSWTCVTAETTTQVFGIVFAHDRFIVTGNQGLIMTSPDGNNWTTQVTNTSATLYDAAFGDNLFVAIGGDTILTSQDGESWNTRFSKGNFLSHVAFGNHRFVAVGDYGSILVSTDGETWTEKSIGAYQQDIQPPVTAETTTGPLSARQGQSISIIWANPPIPPLAWIQNWFTDLFFSNGVFVATTMTGAIVTSHDGEIWTYRRPPNREQPEWLGRITFVNGFLIALTNSETILRSGSIGYFSLKGGLAGDQDVNLEDAIQLMRIITDRNSEISISAPEFFAVDVDGNGKLELPEAIFILQSIAGIRPETLMQAGLNGK